MECMLVEIVYIFLMVFNECFAPSASAFIGASGRALYADSSNNGQPQPSSNCPLPNTIPGQTIDPEKITGTWYAYSVWQTNITQAAVDASGITNYINYFTSFGKSHYPTTDVPASVIQQELAYSINGTCLTSIEASHISTDGRQLGTAYDLSTTPETASIDQSVVIATDYTSYILFYTCANYKASTGICGDPQLSVLTRKLPPALSTDERSIISTAVISAIKPYCTIDFKDFVPYGAWTTTQPMCQPTSGAGSSCYPTLLAAYNSTVFTS
ncbi:uncharacterized protein LOC129594718 [Paramacrobiotus metropolitanus]|uniref:uncharacterized protein LOC129594718 n=1 Tax=Paramacrobiotus metropolitanus TaxID=2943436 RepID=UPI002445CCE1|nr:uncharacterized protein LOC129594718 [Paramacrobiotus metropolitanus]